MLTNQFKIKVYEKYICRSDLYPRDFISYYRLHLVQVKRETTAKVSQIKTMYIILPVYLGKLLKTKL